MGEHSLTFCRPVSGPHQIFGAVAREMKTSTSTPDLLLFDPEIKRTLRHARQVRRQIKFESNLHSQTNDLASENYSMYSSDPDFDLDLSSTPGTSTMGDVLRLTLK
ncbi:hypothetical protein PIB30_040662 [Stylosanthes scabra]|uniref:Uncharacterized protein n=1 Tax=Stylosanthes scabra TaxID=79078 RepID=A0ABU6YDL3_9FABA|nr:hypothetical protein [Stylosanthes scabra]